MKIILVVTGEKGKNVVFISDALRIFSFEEAVRLAKQGRLKGIHPASRKGTVYLRSSRNVPKKKQLEQISVSPKKLLDVASGLKNAPSISPALVRYLQMYETSLKEKGGPFISIDGSPRILTQAVKEELEPHGKRIFDAAKQFTVDPYLLGAIIMDEVARFTPFEDIGEALAAFFVGYNASGGIAQVKVETARGLIQGGYYNPLPSDPKLSSHNIKKASRSHLYAYVKQPKHSISFAAARMRELIDRWSVAVDISKQPEIIATLYHLKDQDKPPHPNPKANERGLQISNEFYQYAKKWLK